MRGEGAAVKLEVRYGDTDSTAPKGTVQYVKVNGKVRWGIVCAQPEIK